MEQTVDVTTEREMRLVLCHHEQTRWGCYMTYGALDWCACVCVHCRRLERDRERERDWDCCIFICCKYSSAVLPTEVSSIHFSDTDRSLLCLSFYVFRLSTFAVFGYPVVTNKIFRCRLHLERIFPSFLSLVLSISSLQLFTAVLVRTVTDRVPQCCNVPLFVAVPYVQLNSDNVHVYQLPCNRHVWFSVRAITVTELIATCKLQLLYVLSTVCYPHGVTCGPDITVGKVASCRLYDLRLSPFHWTGGSRWSAHIRKRWSRAPTPSACLCALQRNASLLTYTAKGSLRDALIAHACAHDDNVM